MNNLANATFHPAWFSGRPNESGGLFGSIASDTFSLA